MFGKAKVDILMSRGDQAFLVREKGKFYLVNVITGQTTQADPPNSPDMFLKLGYFEPAEISNELKQQIIDIFNQK